MCLVLDGIFDGPMSRKSQNWSNLMIDAQVLTNDGEKQLTNLSFFFWKFFDGFLFGMTLTTVPSTGAQHSGQQEHIH
jgi:hypothetical protein